MIEPQRRGEKQIQIWTTKRAKKNKLDSRFALLKEENNAFR